MSLLSSNIKERNKEKLIKVGKTDQVEGSDQRMCINFERDLAADNKVALDIIDRKQKLFNFS